MLTVIDTVIRWCIAITGGCAIVAVTLMITAWLIGLVRRKVSKV